MVDRHLPDDALVAASMALGEVLTRREPLRGSERAVVQRCGRSDGSTVIVKAFLAPCEEWAREAAGLAVLPSTVNAPRLLAVVGEPPLLVMSDLGGWPNVADALLGTNAGAAAVAVTAWAEAVAKLHAETAGAEHRFARVLEGYDATVTPARMPRLLDDAAQNLAAIAAQVGVDDSSAALGKLRGLLPAAGEASALSPADACPDNNLRTSTGFALLDFEGAEYRHVAWDVAYLTVPWPSCWCAWRLPHRVVAEALQRYRVVLAPALPYVATQRFDHDLARARMGWALVSVSWFAANAFGDDAPPSDVRIVAPPRRAMILHRLKPEAGDEAVEPLLARFMNELRAQLIKRWGDVPLQYAPGFRTKLDKATTE